MNPGRGLDAFNFLAAAVQTGFGAFVASYLAGNAWDQAQIGVVLTVQTAASMLLQVPGGALVDATRRQRGLMAAALLGLAGAALLLAVTPEPAPVLFALLLQAACAAVLAPGIVAMSLSRFDPAALGDRLGRNARYAAIGSGLGALAMGAIATSWAENGVFLLAAGLVGPAFWTFPVIGPARPERVKRPAEPALAAGLKLLRDRRLLIFFGCVVLFHLSSAAILPVAAADVTRRAGTQAGMLIAAFIVVPQVAVALLSPAVGSAAQRWGRRRLLLLGFASLPLRGVLFAVVNDPIALVAVQVLEGVAGAVYGVMLPLVAADLAQEGGHTNLCLGLLGLGGALGAGLSTTLGGAVAALAGQAEAFWTLGAVGLAAFALVAAAMPETRPPVLV